MTFYRYWLLCLWLVSGWAHAHNLGTSYSQWQLSESGASVTARISQLQLSRLQLDPRYTEQYAEKVATLLARDLQLWAEKQRCTTHEAKAGIEADGWVSARWHVDCPSAQPWTLRTRLLENVAPSHLHFVRIDAPQQPTQQRVLNFAHPSLTLDATVPEANSLQQFIGIGLSHILSGWDHLAFILMLILLAPRLRDVVWLATGFTLAHSLTLAAASLGWVIVDQARIEALIGFSIALVAAENLWLQSARDPWIPRLLLITLIGVAGLGLFTSDLGQLPLLLSLLVFTTCYFGLLASAPQPQRWRLALTFIFGLIHGFGFAGLMGELALPAEQFLPGLLGFNLGVELGQILIIALIWPLLHLLRRFPHVAAWSSQGVSAAVAGLGIFWFLTRLLV